ncbi:hypothetical protein FE697_015870 [Mumia zhuanghuii]|uniref:Uncharacterized protein n=2 Tax=Mumia TaxID=1546255 RepID=A0ABW1QQR1_9ACTN|nr:MULTISPECIES: hypothetical protein [Mumia]KAA1420442.1 hypothetical protein FE697_015870 [Mumia zhuanghuii]
MTPPPAPHGPASEPVFVDASGRRAGRARRWALIVALPAAAYVIALGSSVLGGPTLPSALLPPTVPEAAQPAQPRSPEPDRGTSAGDGDTDSAAPSNGTTNDDPASDDPSSSNDDGSNDDGSSDDGSDDRPSTPSPTEQVTAPAPTTPAPTTSAPSPTPGRPTSPGNSDEAQAEHKKPAEERGSSSTAPGKAKATATP